MPAPIYLEGRDIWGEMLKNVFPVLMNFFMARQYIQEGIGESELQELKTKNPEVEKLFEKRGERYVLKPEYTDIAKLPSGQEGLKDVLLEYYKRENLKNKIKGNPFTYLGGIQHIITNPVVMAYLSDLSGGVKEREGKRKKEKTEEVFKKYFAPMLFQQFISLLTPKPENMPTDIDWMSLVNLMGPFMLLRQLQSLEGAK